MHRASATQAASPQENITALESIVLPSAPIPSRSNTPPTYILRASSKVTPRRFMIMYTSRLAFSSSPARESLASMFSAKLKLVLCRPASASPAKFVGRREYRMRAYESLIESWMLYSQSGMCPGAVRYGMGGANGFQMLRVA